MSKIKIDLTKHDPVGGGGFVSEILPPDEGPYVLKVRDAKDETSKAGNPMIVFDLDVLENHGDADMSGKSFRQWYPVMDKQPMAGRIRALANACEVPYDRSGVDPDDFIEAEFECDLSVETSGEREFNRIENPRSIPMARDDSEGTEDPGGGDELPPEGEEQPATSSQTRRAPSRGRTRANPPRRSVR